jgi:hypothetical protein
LLRGDVFRDPDSLATMTTLIDTPHAPEASDDGDPPETAMFLFRAEAAGETWWGHGGWWGTTAWTCPHLDVTVVAGDQQARMPDGFDRRAILEDVLGLVRG